jgi:hypothetical protein
MASIAGHNIVIKFDDIHGDPKIRILGPVRKVEARSGWLQRKQPHCSFGPLYSNTSKNLHREKTFKIPRAYLIHHKNLKHLSSGRAN